MYKKIEEVTENLRLNKLELERLQEIQSSVQSEYDAAQASLKTANTKKENAEAAVKEAEAKLEQAKQDAMTAKEKIAEGSLGFFKEMGCQEAVDRIEEYSSGKYAQYWMFGDERDATSLENMKEALEYMKYCQQLLREEQANGNIETSFPGDFKVSLDQIAAAQVGDSSIELTTEVKGPDIRIGLNGTYLKDSLRAITGEEVIFHFNNPKTPVYTEVEHQMELIMPVSIQASYSSMERVL